MVNLKLDLQRGIHLLMLLTTVLIPLFGVFETLSRFGVSDVAGVNLLYLKSLKDLLLVTVIFLGILLLLRSRRKIGLFFLTLLFFLVTVYVSLNSETQDILTIFAGVRWSLPLLLTLVLTHIVNRELLQKVALLLCYLSAFNFIVQVLEMFFMPPFWGVGFFGLSGRLPGFFNQASISGVFSSFSLYTSLYFVTNKKLKALGMTVSILSTILSQSSLGYLLTFFLLSFNFFFKSRFKFLLFFYAIPISFFIFLNLDSLTGRKEGSSVSSFTWRVELFLEKVADSSLISSEFGSGTNTAKNLNSILNVSNDSFIADSLFTTILTNYGLVIFFIFIFFMLIGLTVVIMSKKEGFISVYFLFLLSSVTLITTEIFPVNVLFPLVLSFFFGDLGQNLNQSDRTFA